MFQICFVVCMGCLVDLIIIPEALSLNIGHYYQHWRNTRSNLDEMGRSNKCTSDTEWDAEINHCCTACLPGFGVEWPCTKETSDTKCMKCIDGINYSNVRSHNAVCQECTKCPKNSRETHACTATHNRKCECEANHFYDKTKNECTLCKSCRAGEGLERKCSAAKGDTVCAACPKGFYMNEKTHLLKCKRCSNCRDSEQTDSTKRRCIPTQDCKDASSADSNITGDSRDWPKAAEVSDHNNIIPIYCAILGAVVVVLVLYVIVKKWRILPCHKEVVESMGAKSVTSIHSDPRGNMSLSTHSSPQMKIAGANRMSGNFSATTAEKKPILICPTTRVKDLPSSLRRLLYSAVGTPLVPGSDWMALARQLDYNNTKIRKIESQSLQNAQTQQQSTPAILASRMLLTEWAAKSPDSTIERLQEALCTIGRPDIAEYLAHALTGIDGDSCALTIGSLPQTIEPHSAVLSSSGSGIPPADSNVHIV